MRGYTNGNCGGGSVYPYPLINGLVYPESGEGFLNLHASYLLEYIPRSTGFYFTNLDFKYAHFTDENNGYFEFVPETDSDAYLCSYRFIDGMYPKDPIYNGYKPIVPLIQRRLYFGQTIPEIVYPPDVPTFAGLSTSKQNTKYVGTGTTGTGINIRNIQSYDPSGNPVSITEPSITMDENYNTTYQSTLLGASWKINSLGKYEFRDIYATFPISEIPKTITTLKSPITAVSKYARVMLNPPPITSGFVQSTVRVMWLPTNLNHWYFVNNPTYPYL